MACDVQTCKNKIYGTIEIHNIQLDVDSIYDLCQKHYQLLQQFLTGMLKGDTP